MSPQREQVTQSTSSPTGSSDASGAVVPAAAVSILRKSHEQLDALAETVIRAIVAGDRNEAADAIGILQTSVGAHLDGEERDLLPAYAREKPEDAAAILADHADIRQTLAAYDIETDLHLLRADGVSAFLAKLRAHAQRENAGLYAWCETH